MSWSPSHSGGCGPGPGCIPSNLLGNLRGLALLKALLEDLVVLLGVLLVPLVGMDLEVSARV